MWGVVRRVQFGSFVKGCHKHMRAGWAGADKLDRLLNRRIDSCTLRGAKPETRKEIHCRFGQQIYCGYAVLPGELQRRASQLVSQTRAKEFGRHCNRAEQGRLAIELKRGAANYARAGAGDQCC